MTGGAAPEAHHLPRPEYLDAVIKESMRLTPSRPSSPAGCTRPNGSGAPRSRPARASAPTHYAAHRRPDAWPDPDRFDPTRFVGARPSPFTFFPFGGGVRRCLGAAFATYEMKIVLTEVLSRVDLRIASGYRMRARPAWSHGRAPRVECR